MVGGMGMGVAIHEGVGSSLFFFSFFFSFFLAFRGDGSAVIPRPIGPSPAVTLASRLRWRASLLLARLLPASLLAPLLPPLPLLPPVAAATPRPGPSRGEVEAASERVVATERRPCDDAVLLVPPAAAPAAAPDRRGENPPVGRDATAPRGVVRAGRGARRGLAAGVLAAGVPGVRRDGLRRGVAGRLAVTAPRRVDDFRRAAGGESGVVTTRPTGRWRPRRAPGEASGEEGKEGEEAEGEGGASV